MSLGNASIKRATGAIGKTGEKSKKAAFTANRSLIELEISKIKFERSACDLAELKKSVKKYGILHPVFVLREGEEFILLSGKARMTAAAELGMESVPAVVLDMEGSRVSAAKKRTSAQKSGACTADDLGRDRRERRYSRRKIQRDQRDRLRSARVPLITDRKKA